MELIGWTDMVRFFAALVFVLALMGGLAMVLRKFGNRHMPQSLRTHRRLKMVEMLSLDGRRRLVLLRRDDVEHLVILNPNGETVIETGIRSQKTDEHVAETQET